MGTVLEFKTRAERMPPADLTPQESYEKLKQLTMDDFITIIKRFKSTERWDESWNPTMEQIASVFDAMAKFVTAPKEQDNAPTTG